MWRQALWIPRALRSLCITERLRERRRTKPIYVNWLSWSSWAQACSPPFPFMQYNFVACQRNLSEIYKSLELHADFFASAYWESLAENRRQVYQAYGEQRRERARRPREARKGRPGEVKSSFISSSSNKSEEISPDRITRETREQSLSSAWEIASMQRTTDEEIL